MATVFENAQFSNSKICLQKAEKTKASRLSQNSEDESTSSEQNHENAVAEYECDISSSQDEDPRRRRKKEIMNEGSIKATKDASLWFKKRDPKHPSLKKIKPSNSLYKRVLSYRLYRLRRTIHERTFRETVKVKNSIKKMEIPLPSHYFNEEDSSVS